MDWATPFPFPPPCRINREYLPNSNTSSTVSDRRIRWKSPFLDNPTLHTSGKPRRVVSSVHESPLSQPSVPSATISSTCCKVHNLSTEMIFQSRRTLMPCSNWRLMSLSWHWWTSVVKPQTINGLQDSDSEIHVGRSVCACVQGMRPATKEHGRGPETG